MSEEAIHPEGNNNDLVVRGADGDPVQDNGTKMLEKESYERVIAGLAMSADASVHLARTDPEHAMFWRQMARNLDLVRRGAVQYAGLDSTIKLRETQDVRGQGMAWRPARDRFKDGIRQAAGGMRQLAMCFRMDLTWSRMANDLEAMDRKMDARQRRTTQRAQRSGLIWMPGDAI